MARCQYTLTGWDSKFDLPRLSQCGSTYNCLSRSVPEIHWRVAGTLRDQKTTTTTTTTRLNCRIFSLRGPNFFTVAIQMYRHSERRRFLYSPHLSNDQSTCCLTIPRPSGHPFDNAWHLANHHYPRVKGGVVIGDRNTARGSRVHA